MERPSVFQQLLSELVIKLAVVVEWLNSSPLYRKCESRRRFNLELGTSAHAAGRQQLSVIRQMGSCRMATFVYFTLKMHSYLNNLNTKPYRPSAVII